ncbi:MAB_1171c family putative transporter [Streptomyces sp. NPDC051211]|uniref:MAB_1171c family putative transporter n=1 Tax=Streptomyces sp. NPDC051211 TaxID=3154643 RepID=UPI00344BC5C9
MTSGITALGDWLAVPAVVCLWAAVLIRTRSAVRCREQRGLLLAVATAAAAMTLNLPAVVDYAMRNPGHGHTVGLTRNLIGVLSAGAVLYFVAATTRGRRLQRAACAATVAYLGTLVALDLAAPSHGTHTMPAHGDPVPSTAYWLVLISAHLLANTVCVSVCWRYSRRTDSPGLAAGLWLFGLGTALAGLFWLAYLFKALYATVWPMPYLPLLMNLHGLLRAAALLVPVLFLLRRTLADSATAWRLWPLWRDLVQAVPHVVLTRARGSRLAELLWPPVPRTLLAYRKVIETRDAILILNEYVAPGVPELARGHVAEAGIPGPLQDAAVLACVLKEARQAKLAGLPQQQGEESPVYLSAAAAAPEGSGLDEEKQFLVAVAQAYGSPATGSFSPALPVPPAPPRK